MKNFLLGIAILLVTACSANKPLTVDDLKPVTKRLKDCENYLMVIKKFPKEVGLNLYQKGNTVYLSSNDYSYFESLLKHTNSGIAIDIVLKNQFECEDENINRDNNNPKGEIWKIFTKNDLLALENLSQNPKKLLLTLGVLPEKYRPEETECNLIFFENKYFCSYTPFVNLDNQFWKLLEMGLYKDSVKTRQPGKVYSFNEKVFEFDIPFEKNDATINDKNLTAIYDSLNFTDFDISSINILAFASVEGDTELNKRLVESRSKNVVEALQTYQKPEIVYQIDALENWDQFYGEVKRTRFKYLAEKSKEELKTLFKTNKSLMNTLEPLMRRHRKAIVKIYLTRKRVIELMDESELVSFFNETAKKEDTERLLILLDYVLSEADKKSDPRSFTDKLLIPTLHTNGPLLNNLANFKTEREIYTESETFKAFEELHRIYPKNEMILYNFIAVKLDLLRFNINRSKIREMKVLMDQLQTSRLPPKLKYRPWINYYILANEYYRQENEYANSNRAINNISSIYKNVTEYEDILKIALYLSSYRKYESAERIMKSVIYEEDIPDDLLFYYLNITLPYSRYHKLSSYDSLVKKAVTLDRERFCQFVNSRNDDGISFQLMDRLKVKEYFCEVCNQ